MFRRKIPKILFVVYCHTIHETYIHPLNCLYAGFLRYIPKTISSISIVSAQVCMLIGRIFCTFLVSCDVRQQLWNFIKIVCKEILTLFRLHFKLRFCMLPTCVDLIHRKHCLGYKLLQDVILYFAMRRHS